MKRKFLYDIIELWILSYQSREFNKFFWAINCCSYKTHGFHKIFASENISAFLRNFGISHFHKKNSMKLFSRNFASFISVKKCNFTRKFFQNATKNVRICEHLHDLYTLNSLSGWKGLTKFIPREFFKFHSNIYSILFDYSLGNKTFQIIHQLSYFVGQPVHDILFYS